MEKEEVEEKDRILIAGRPAFFRTDNMVKTSKYTPITFIPVAVMEQFRRFANLYFLIVGCIMAVGWYTDAFESAINPSTTLGPLALVISFSLIVEGAADAKRHRNDEETNNAPCVILRRTEEFESEDDAERDENLAGGKDVVVNLNKTYFMGQRASSNNNNEPETPIPRDQKATRVCFQRVRRMDIRQGHFIVVKNREMVPADMILVASSSENGSSYIETSSIDGETNLKLRTSPHLPTHLLKHYRDGEPMEKMESIREEGEEDEEDDVNRIETLEQATKRVTRLSALSNPTGVCVLRNPDYKGETTIDEAGPEGETGVMNMFQKKAGQAMEAYTDKGAKCDKNTKYVAALTSEPPNPHVNTFTGKLTLPPVEDGGECHDIPLGAENILLRGAVVRNTEWVIGLVVFTGTDTKLVRNSFETPSKFSQLDKLMNQTVLLILLLMAIIITYLSSQATVTTRKKFDDLWYVGYKKDSSAPWPYLPDFDPPAWDTTEYNWLQMFFLYVTLLNNMVPLSLYVTVEFVTFCMLWLVYVDLDMYCDVTNTRAVARSTIVTDLGRVQYVFSDKTGTLTQNVMRFKRCSVDGLMFGAPIAKSRPGAEQKDKPSEFHPLKRLLVGNVRLPSVSGLQGLGEASGDFEVQTDNKLTLNAEMFCRVLSLCHTVVVEKDLDMSSTKKEAKAVKKKAGLFASLFSSEKKETNDTTSSKRESKNAPVETAPAVEPGAQGPDGAPYGFAYQAESPDEGALVSAASKTFGFQVVTRDSSGIKLRVNSPSLLRDESLVESLKDGSMSLLSLAADSGSDVNYSGAGGDISAGEDSDATEETWEILAVNKFDSDRKRMSILLRSPPELGGIPILFCKGADSAMLDPGVCTGLPAEDDDAKIADRAFSKRREGKEREDEWEVAQTLGLQAHLGDFASEGLRTLVLGMRILNEEECESWIDMYKKAATSLKDRDDMLTAAAKAVETQLYIVGATAIEDKLQVGVPDAIATLERAGIKLWVLTGDKRETAVEIGYSTHVLTNKMHLTEVPDNGADHVRTQMCMEFIRLVKLGKLSQYQRAEVENDNGSAMASYMFTLGKFHRSCSRARRNAFYQIFLALGIWKGWAEKNLHEIKLEEAAEEQILLDRIRRKNVRDRAEKVIQEWLKSAEGVKQRQMKKGRREPSDDGNTSLASEELPRVFSRAQSARTMLSSMKSEGQLSESERRSLSLAHVTAANKSRDDDLPLVDEDTLSLDSFFPDKKATTRGDFDQRKRTLLERMFAVDRDVRKGKLMKHMNSERLATILEAQEAGQQKTPSPTDGPRALVIEGAALKHLLGDPELEELLFAVASNCDAVIACRVSPKQKALLVNLVRHNIVPEPVTLAIGDGANDVGMIQEAHVGVGISGKEGKQAVNASDFAIAQFRFLESLVLVHGRWDFFRQSVVVLFSFYKNAVMVGCIIVFSGQTVFSGTPLFDEWVISVLNFICGIPIIILGLFDRCLSKEYVLRHPEVYNPTRNNELLSMRMRVRWVCMCFVHIFVIYYLSVLPHEGGGGYTSAFVGLMNNVDQIGDGEGADLKSVGVVAFSNLVLVLGYKVLYESKSLIHGRWPAFTCREGVGEGFFSRVAYSWHGVIWGSFIFYIFFISVYTTLGWSGAGTFSDFVGMGYHVFSTRVMTWVLVLFVPFIAMLFDVVFKTFSNMFYPTQTQIHLEIECNERMDKRRFDREQAARYDRQAEA